jgi:hypothetical protein
VFSKYGLTGNLIGYDGPLDPAVLEYDPMIRVLGHPSNLILVMDVDLKKQYPYPPDFDFDFNYSQSLMNPHMLREVQDTMKYYGINPFSYGFARLYKPIDPTLIEVMESFCQEKQLEVSRTLGCLTEPMTLTFGQNTRFDTTSNSVEKRLINHFGEDRKYVVELPFLYYNLYEEDMLDMCGLSDATEVVRELQNVIPSFQYMFNDQDNPVIDPRNF